VVAVGAVHYWLALLVHQVAVAVVLLHLLVVQVTHQALAQAKEMLVVLQLLVVAEVEVVAVVQVQ
jgi:hypothetical protein